MKKIIFSLLLSFIALPVLSQDSLNKPSNTIDENRQASVLLMGEYVLGDNFNMQSFGIGMSIPVGKHMGINYRLSFGTSANRQFYMRTTGGGVVGCKLLSEVAGDGPGIIKTVGVLLLFLPEGISYTMNIGNKIKLTHYVNPFCVDYLSGKGSLEEELNYTAEMGSSIRIPLGPKFYALPHGGIKFFYGQPRFGFEGGVSIGLLIKD